MKLGRSKMSLLHALRTRLSPRSKTNLHGASWSAFTSRRDDLENIQIPLPPLDVQQEIVAEIEGYQKVINGARAVLDNYRPHIPIHPDWPM